MQTPYILKFLVPELRITYTCKPTDFFLLHDLPNSEGIFDPRAIERKSRGDQDVDLELRPAEAKLLIEALEARENTLRARCDRYAGLRQRFSFAYEESMATFHATHRDEAAVLSPDFLLQEVTLLSTTPTVVVFNFADVYEGKHNGQTVAMHRFPVFETSNVLTTLKTIYREFDRLNATSSHPNILKFRGADVTACGGKICLVSEWMFNQPLNAYIQQHDLETTAIDDLLLGIARGLAHLHGHGVAHGDIRCINILVDEQGCPRLANIGRSRTLAGESSIRWSAQEKLSGKQGYALESDMYALGCTFIEAYTGRQPFKDIEDDATVIRLVIRHKKSPSRPSCPEGDARQMTNAVWLLVVSCLSWEPDKRTTAAAFVSKLEGVIEKGKNQIASPSKSGKGRQRALVIGFNYTDSKETYETLSGCDIEAYNIVEQVLVSHGFEDVKILTDVPRYREQRPTKDNIINGMKWLVKDAGPHDVLFFYFSGHGDQLPAIDDDELDGQDEALVPCDFNDKPRKQQLIRDNDIHEIMVKHLPKGCRLIAVFDCSHSGSALDLPYTWAGGSAKPTVNTKAVNKRSSEADVISLSSCGDSEDAEQSHKKGGDPGVTLTRMLIKTLEDNGTRSMTYGDLLRDLQEYLEEWEQSPELGSSHSIDPAHVVFNLKL